jgi:hypothetical protein
VPKSRRAQQEKRNAKPSALLRQKHFFAAMMRESTTFTALEMSRATRRFILRFPHDVAAKSQLL